MTKLFHYEAFDIHQEIIMEQQIDQTSSTLSTFCPRWLNAIV